MQPGAAVRLASQATNYYLFEYLRKALCAVLIHLLELQKDLNRFVSQSVKKKVAQLLPTGRRRGEYETQTILMTL